MNTKGRIREQRGRRTSVPYCKVFILPCQIQIKFCSCFHKGICGRISPPYYTFTLVTEYKEIHKAKSQNHTHIPVGRMLAARLPYILPLNGRRRYGCPGSQLTCSANIRSATTNMSEQWNFIPVRKYV
jgi:hypothetical protein